MNGVVWLASYPKSGNTWLRVVFANLLRADQTPQNINQLALGPHAAVRRLFDNAVGYEVSNLTHDEVDAIRPDLYRHWASKAAGVILCKVHDACTARGGSLLFPPDATRGVIYVIRNPLDVCVSSAHHSGHRNPDLTAAEMSDPHHTIGETADARRVQFRQRLLSWSGHVLSWTEARDLPVLVVRYEDMHAEPLKTFAAAAAFAGLPADPETVARAVAFSAFDELQRQEREHGFVERASQGREFFRKGKAGSWRDVLTDAQAARIIKDHRDVMRRFGYLTDADEPVY